MAWRLPAFIIIVIAAFGILANMTDDTPLARATETSPAGPSATVHTGTASQFLRTIIGVGVKGNLKPGKKPYAAGTRVEFNFTPVAEYSAAMVVLDGKLVRSTGTIIMSADHWIWAFGNPEKGTAFKNVMTVPSDATKIPYPDFYQKRPSFTFKVADPYCALTSNVIAYPRSYLGAFPMPDVMGAPLPSSIPRGVSPHDVWSPTLNKGCDDDMHSAFLSTLRRWKELNVHYLMIPQWTRVVDCKADSLQLATGAGMNIPDAELAWIVKQAKKAGFEVYELMQVASRDMNQVLMPNPPPLDFASRFLDAYKRFIVGRAALAQQLGIAAFRLDWGDYWFDWTPYKDLFLEKMTKAAKLVRSVYHGKIMCGNLAPDIEETDDNFKSQFDWLEQVFTLGGITEAENANITVSLLKEKLLNDFTGIAYKMGSVKKPVLMGLFVQSYRDFLVKGWVEDTEDTGEQKKLQIDFSVQAIAYEAALEAIAEQTQLTVVGVGTYHYWWTDCILPKDSFPNHSASIRNKPAESILYQWFRKR